MHKYIFFACYFCTLHILQSFIDVRKTSSLFPKILSYFNCKLLRFQVYIVSSCAQSAATSHRVTPTKLISQHSNYWSCSNARGYLQHGYCAEHRALHCFTDGHLSGFCGSFSIWSRSDDSGHKMWESISFSTELEIVSQHASEIFRLCKLEICPGILFVCFRQQG